MRNLSLVISMDVPVNFNHARFLSALQSGAIMEDAEIQFTYFTNKCESRWQKIRGLLAELVEQIFWKNIETI